MSIKEKLVKVREVLEDKKSSIDCVKTDNGVVTKGIVNLDDKVDEFINWYYENMVKGHYTKTGEYHLPKEMRNLIEKMAVWYELRYPSY